MEEVSIFSRLPAGEENAVRGEDIAKRLGFNDTRDFQRAVSLERRNGSLILSSAKGYYRPSEITDVRRCYYSIRRRAISTLVMLMKMREYLQRFDPVFRDENMNQMTINDFLEPDGRAKDRRAQVRKGLL